MAGALRSLSHPGAERVRLLAPVTTLSAHHKIPRRYGGLGRARDPRAESAAAATRGSSGQAMRIGPTQPTASLVSWPSTATFGSTPKTPMSASARLTVRSTAEAKRPASRGRQIRFRRVISGLGWGLLPVRSIQPTRSIAGDSRRSMRSSTAFSIGPLTSGQSAGSSGSRSKTPPTVRPPSKRSKIARVDVGGAADGWRVAEIASDLLHRVSLRPRPRALRAQVTLPRRGGEHARRPAPSRSRS